jgi:GDP-L-fucose synthase
MENMQIKIMIDTALQSGVEVYFSEVLASIKTSATTAKRNLLTDTLEPTNEWYAIAKITGVKLSSHQKSIQ